MENENADIYSCTSFSKFLVSVASNLTLNKDIWQLFGYTDRPKRGSYFNKFIKHDILCKEYFILREVFCATIGCGIVCVPYDHPYNFKEIIVSKCVNYLFSMDSKGITISFGFKEPDELIEHLSEVLLDYIESDEKELSIVFNQHAMNQLGNLYDARFLVGGTRLFLESFYGLKVAIKNHIKYPIIMD